MLGPVLERIHYELLNPLIYRTFLLAWEAGLIPPPPAELEGQPTRIEYISILSQAQKAVGVNRIEQASSYLGSLVAVFPELKHGFKPFVAFSEYNKAIGTPPGIMPSEEEYNKAVAAEQKSIQAAQSAELGNSIAQSASLMSDIDPANVQALLTGSQGGLAL
jgi:hypothetical protein